MWIWRILRITVMWTIRGMYTAGLIPVCPMRMWKPAALRNTWATLFQDRVVLGGGYTVWHREEALFIGRYVRSMDYVHEPGMLFFKMGNAFLEEVTGMGRELTSEAAVGIVDGSGQLCLSSVPEEVSLGEERQKEIGDRIDETLEAGMFLEGERIRGGALSAYREKNSGLVVFSYVPDSVLSKGLGPVFLVLTAIYILVILLAAVLSIYFSRSLQNRSRLLARR